MKTLFTRRHWRFTFIGSFWILLLITIGVQAAPAPVPISLDSPVTLSDGLITHIRFQAPQKGGYRLMLSGGSAEIVEGSTYMVGFLDDTSDIVAVCNAGEAFEIALLCSQTGTAPATLKVEPVPDAGTEYRMLEHWAGMVYWHGRSGSTHRSFRSFTPARDGIFKVVRANMDITVSDRVWAPVGVLDMEGQTVNNKTLVKTGGQSWNDELFVTLKGGETYFITSTVTGYYEKDQAVLGSNTTLRVEELPQLTEGAALSVNSKNATDEIFRFVPSQSGTYLWNIADSNGTSSYTSGTDFSSVLAADGSAIPRMDSPSASAKIDCTAGTVCYLRVYIRSSESLSVEIHKMTEAEKKAEEDAVRQEKEAEEAAARTDEEKKQSTADDSAEDTTPISPSSAAKAGKTGAAAKALRLPKGTAFTLKNIRYKVTKAGTAGKTAGEVQVTGLKKKVSSVSIPATVTWKKATMKVTSIAGGAFQKQKKLKKVTIGKNVRSIGKKAFYQDSKLKTVKIQSKLIRSIGKQAFTGIPKNAKITMPASRRKAYKELLKKAS